ncbi:MAG: DUF2868 domain-containing protein [Nitrospira sp.]|nr:DUF2868 domain-containing protein [Nitrospira sp.]
MSLTELFRVPIMPSRNPWSSGGEHPVRRTGQPQDANDHRVNHPTQLAAKVLLVQACEEHDPDHKFILRYEREPPRQGEDLRDYASAEDSARAGEARVIERAERISERLMQKHPALTSAFAVLRIKTPLTLLIGCAVVGGFLADPIGPAGHINLLNFPLLTLLLWNTVAYVGLLYNRILPRSSRDRSQPGLPGFVEWFLGLDMKRRLHRLRSDRTQGPEEAQWIAASLASYAGRFLHSVQDLLSTHARSLLHVAAAALAIGVIAGLYLRGFSFLYKAGWDSTFMEAEGVYSFLSILFAPASWLLATPVPGVETIADLRGSAKANAAVWIHFWAVTTGLFIVVPRMVLAAAAWMRKTRLADAMHLPSDEPYFRRLLNPYRGKGLHVEVLAYSHRVKEADDRLMVFLSDAFGVLADIHVEASVQYGERPPHCSVDSDRGLCVVVLFNVAQAPEETHSEFLEELKATIQKRGRPNMLLVLLDCGAYSQIDHEKRLKERCQAWATLTKECGVKALIYQDPSGSPDRELQAVSNCLWPGDFRGRP